MTHELMGQGSPEAKVETERGHILAVDDNRVNRLKLSRSLEQQGHKVTLAENGNEALELLRAEPLDVVLLDILMPGMDGYQVLRIMKDDSKLRDIPVIVISALDEIDSAVKCIEMGAEDYLAKPFNPVLLRARLSASLEKKQLRDSGPDIPADIQSKIFDPFFTTKPQGEGAGLGLNISHNVVVQKHHGQIAVHSEPGMTSFEVQLPINFEVG